MRIRTWISQFPILIFFIGTYILSWFGAYLLVLPELLRGEPIPKMAGLEMFPLMLLGPAIMGIFLTKSLYGRKGVRDLFRNRYARLVNLKWYFFLLLPPAAISFVLFILSHMYKPVFTPHYFLIGFLFGIPAGVLEEIGWTGFAFPKLRKKFNFAPAACFLGFAWGLWHFPVIDFLGSATPHGDYLVPFFLSFILVMAAIRVIICHIYEHTGSILLAQLFHVCSTGSLVVLGPQKISAAQESLWYFAYVTFLWLVIILFKKRLLSESAPVR